MKTKQWGTSRRVSYDGVIRQEVATQAHEPGVVVSNLTQPSRNLILNRNRNMRNGKVEKDLSFGRHVACVPLVDLEGLKKLYPGLNSKDGKVRHITWSKILTNPEHKKYLVVDKY